MRLTHFLLIQSSVQPSNFVSPDNLTSLNGSLQLSVHWWQNHWTRSHQQKQKWWVHGRITFSYRPRKKLELHRISVAFYAPQVVSSWNCDNVAACEVEWDKAWWSCYAKHLLYPDEPKSCRAAMAEFEKACVPKMCGHCRGNSIEKVWENSHVFDKEDVLVSEGIDELVRWMNAL